MFFLIIGLRHIKNDLPKISKNLSIHSIQNELMTKIIKNNPQFKLYDQDALNYKFAKKFYHLPPYFNVSIYKELIKNNFCNSIYHYLRSLSNLNKGKFVQLYRKYYKKTPWYDI